MLLRESQPEEVIEPEPTPQRKVNYLLSFVDPKDPFAVGPVAGEELTGPILSIMSTREFDSLFLFCTPHTRANALATADEVKRRYPRTRVVMSMELILADPKNYRILLSLLTERVRKENLHLELQKPHVQAYICISSGTAEMRGAWFLLTGLGVLPAKLLQVGTPAEPLFGGANVKEIAVHTSDWMSLRDLAMPAEYFRTDGFQRQLRGESRDRAGRLGSPSAKPTASLAKEPDAPPRARKPDFTGGIEELDELALDSASEDLSSLSKVSGDMATSECRDVEVPGLDDALQELGIHIGSANLRHAAERAAIAAASDLPVLLQGETGTGKERFAHLIHRMSARASSELVAVNCASIPDTLAEDYLFGHAKGAFSGATGERKGMFESADRSTLFLDEIAELPLEIQAKLLRVIQDSVVQRLGTTAPRKVNVRIIAATNRDLQKEVAAGRFREDLYFRLEVVQIQLPALRERRGEIADLALALLRQINLRRLRPRQLTTGALLRLEQYHWPGNVRQLSNVLERSVLYARNDVIQPEDLIINENQHDNALSARLPEPFAGFKIEDFLTEVREVLFIKALEACNGNQTEAAERLGVSKQAVSKFLASRATTKIDAQ